MSVLDFHRRMFDHSLYNYRHYVVFIIMTYSLFNFLTSIFPSGLFDYQSVYTDLCAAIKTEIMVIRIKKMNTKICVIHNSWFWGIQIFVKDNVLQFSHENFCCFAFSWKNKWNVMKLDFDNKLNLNMLPFNTIPLRWMRNTV